MDYRGGGIAFGRFGIGKMEVATFRDRGNFRVGFFVTRFLFLVLAKISCSERQNQKVIAK